MAPSRHWRDLAQALLVLSACSEPAPPPKAPIEVDPLEHTWRIDQHVFSSTTSLTDADADEYYGRRVVITSETYQTPFHGTCTETAGRLRRKVILGDIALELELPAKSRKQAAKFGLGKNLREYKLACNPDSRTPPLTIYVAGNRAMTCFAGACYLMSY